MKYYVDGFTVRANPSPYGGGFTVTDEDGNLIHREVVNKKGFTNNEGEILGIRFCLNLATTNDQISSDSMTCMSWVHKGSSKSRPDLFSVLSECKHLKIQKNINLMWEGREYNKAGWINEHTKEKISLFD